MWMTAWVKKLKSLSGMLFINGYILVEVSLYFFGLWDSPLPSFEENEQMKNEQKSNQNDEQVACPRQNFLIMVILFLAGFGSFWPIFCG